MLYPTAEQAELASLIPDARLATLRNGAEALIRRVEQRHPISAPDPRVEEASMRSL